jgi:hypothetical protein
MGVPYCRPHGGGRMSGRLGGYAAATGSKQDSTTNINMAPPYRGPLQRVHVGRHQGGHEGQQATRAVHATPTAHQAPRPPARTHERARRLMVLLHHGWCLPSILHPPMPVCQFCCPPEPPTLRRPTPDTYVQCGHGLGTAHEPPGPHVEEALQGGTPRSLNGGSAHHAGASGGGGSARHHGGSRSNPSHGGVPTW